MNQLSFQMIHLVMMMKQVDCCGAPNRVRGGGRDGPGGERSFKSFNVWASLTSPLSSIVSVQLKTVKLATLTSLWFCCQKKKYNLS